MMTGAPQHIEIFVTHVAEDGPLLKIWGQLDRSAATFVERLILQYTEQFDRGIGVVHASSLSVDQLCCAKYGGDGVYYRARIADLSAVQRGYIRVNFIDYGNSDLVEICNIRSLQAISSSPLCSVQNQATEFTLAGVVPPMGVGWDHASVDFIREKLCYAEFRCAIVAQISGRRLITLYYNETDFSEILIQKNLAIRITLHAQQAMFHNMQHQFSSVQSYNYSLPPLPPVPASYTSNANTLVKAASITKQESGVISAPILSVGSKHVIYISYVEDGPNLFAVQLKATEGILQNMTQTFAHVPLKPFSQSPIPGSACVSLLPQAKVMCRAVVTNLMEKECVVYCVDFGNTETVPFSLIYEMPSQFLNTKSLAMRFCLAGIQNTAFGEKAKRIFQELVTGETLTLEVIEPEGPPLKQYGNIYLNGANILHIMKEKLKDLEKNKAYPQLPAIQLGRFVNVTVAYVESVDNFYVQYEANAKALTKIMTTMTEYCNNSAAMIQPNELYIGMPVCALFSADQQWYRAKVLSVTADQISVFYVDYGNTDTVNLISLRQMDTNLSQAQAQAVACCLSGYEDPIASLENLSNRFEEMTLERKLTMKIVNRLSNGKFVVELHDTTVAPIVNIGQKLISPIKTYEETPIDEWHDPAASGEPAAVQTPVNFGKEKRYRKSKDQKQKKNSSSRGQYGKFGKLEDGGGEGWRTDSKRSGTWNESRDNAKKWGNRDDKGRNDKKWNRDDQDMEQNRWGRDERDVKGGWENREERGANKQDFSKDLNWKDKENKRGFNRDNGDWKDRDSNKRGFDKDDDWKDRDNNKRGFNKDDDWKDKDNNKRGFNKDDDWKNRDNTNKRSFSKDNDDRNWRRRDEQGQREKKWWGHDDRGEQEKKWGLHNERQGSDRKRVSKDDSGDRVERKWSNRDNKQPSGENRKWNDGDGGNKNSSQEGNFWKDNGPSTVSENNWDADDTVETKQIEVTDGTKAYCEPLITLGMKEAVTLVFAEDPTNFVIQIDSKIKELEKIMKSIAAFYEIGGAVIPESNQKVNSPCVTRYSEDNKWYRAIITSAPCDNMTEVRFVDYGNHEAVSSNDVKEVAPEFLSIPLFGIPCSLFAAQMPGAEWSSDQITEFLNVADGKKLEAHFIKKEGTLFQVLLNDIEDTSLSINEKFGASKSSLREEMPKKQEEDTKRVLHNLTPLKHSVLEMAYAPFDDKFSVFEPEAEAKDTVCVTWFINPDQFYCQCSSSLSALTSMINDIQIAYKGRPHFKGDLAVGCPVIAQFPADKVLYRAEVKELIGLKYKVQYVDYGNMELLDICNIWQIEKHFMELPKQAVTCCLSGVMPVESEWPNDCTEFERLFGAAGLDCVFHCIKDGKNYVSLAVNGKDVAEELVTCNVAIHKVEERVVPEENLALILLKGQQIPVHVCFIESVSKFFVHLNPVAAKSIQEKVNKHILEAKDCAPIQQADMVEHQMCLATPDGSQWFRGKIIDTSGTVGVCVTFVDFGDSDDVPLDRIRPISDALTGFRHQATECFVTGSDDWDGNKDVEESFKLEVQVEDVILQIEDIVNNRLSVHLFDIEGQRLELLKNVDKSSPLDVEPLCPMPILTYTVRMWVSHVDSLDNIWLQKENEAEILSGLLELLYNFYEDEGKGLELGDPQTGQLCAAKSNKDGSWYRAKVKNVDDDNICVMYIDYGNSETLSRDNVKELDPSFCRVYSLSTCASLATTNTDFEGSLIEFEKITAEKVFDVSFTRNEDKWSIQMENDDVNIICHLLKSNLVSEMNTMFQSEHVTLPLGEKIDVSISHFESFSELWVQMDCHFVDIMTLQQTLQTIGSSQAILQSVEEGALCITQFSDEAWYRAEVLESKEGTAKVLFLDYGNIYTTDAKSLRKLPVKFFHWPFFAVRCQISEETFLKNTELAEKCAELLSDSDAVFQLQVVESDNPVLVALFVGENDLHKAVLERKANVDGEHCTEGNISVSENVFVSHVCSPAKFWIQNENSPSDLQNLADLLIWATDFAAVDSAEVGGVYAALFEEDQQWYRAKVLEQCDDGYNVLFVDYGNSSLASNLRVLPQELVNRSPVAKCCQLEMPAGVTYWSAEADERFVELCGEGTVLFQVNMLPSEEPFRVGLFFDGRNVSDILGELCVSSRKLSANEGDTTGTITHIKSLCEFWIHWDSESSKLEFITEKLDEAVNFEPLQEISDGLLCIAQFPDDERWYRARIISCQDQNIEVFFIDYGNIAVVTEVHCIPDDLAVIPALAKQCSLALPTGVEKWSGKAEEEFISIFGDGTNIYEITVINEGIHSIVSLKLNGYKLEDMLEKFCVETADEISDELSRKTSSPEIEILSESEVIDNVDLQNAGERLNPFKQQCILRSEDVSEVIDFAGATEVAKNILSEVIENILSSNQERPTNDEASRNTVLATCESDTKKETLNIIDEKSEKSETIADVLEEMIEASTEYVHKQDTEVLPETLANAIALPLSPNVLHTSSNSNQEIEFPISSKKSDVTSAKQRHGVEHSEQIIRDFSVELQTPEKHSLPDSNQDLADAPWTGSPVRRLSHAERIVPGSISSGLSQTGQDSSLENKGKQSHEDLCVHSDIAGEERSKHSNISNECQNIDQNEAKENLSMGVNVPQKLSTVTDMKNSALLKNVSLHFDDETVSAQIDQENKEDTSVKETRDPLFDNTVFSDTQCSNKSPTEASGQDKDNSKICTLYSTYKQNEKNVSNPHFDNSSIEPESLSNTLNELSPLPSALQKKNEHGASGSTINDMNVASDTSEANSISVSLSSPRKGYISTELESETSGDVSGMCEDSDSSVTCTAVNDSFVEGAKLGLDESKTKCYQFAQMHLSEEHYESSKSLSKSSNLPSDKSEITKMSLSEPDKSPMEEQKDEM